MKKLWILLVIICLATPAFALQPKDYFKRTPQTQESPATRAYAITTSDSLFQDPVPRAIYIGVTGDLTVLLKDATAPVTFIGVPQGIWFPIRPKVIYNSSTATDLIGGY